MAQDWVGKTIGGRYQIDSLLGQGGMSAVYRATDPNLRRPVAIKLIHPHLATNPNFVGRFKEEASAVARLRHPNIVQVHDFDNDGDTYYMVMEYLVGETLQAQIKRLNATHRTMPYPQVIRICTQMCEAVGYAHSHELIHRDIKPANIMLDLNGQAILMDFGIVKIVGGEYHTSTGATLGTARYMSPEQIRGERADERADIYSLGVTLYEMISGRVPYQADSVVPLMMMVLNDPLPDIRDIRKGIPENLAAVVEKALAKRQVERFQTMEEMGAALQRAQEEAAGKVPADTVVEAEPTQQATAPDMPAQRLEEIAPSATPTLIDLPTEPVPPSKAIPTRSSARWIIIAAAALLLLGAAAAAGIGYVQSQKAPILQIAPISQPPAPIDAQTAQLVVSLGRWETNSLIAEVDYSPAGDLIGTANNRQSSSRFSKYRFYGAVWQVGRGSIEGYLLGHTQRVNSLAFSPDGHLLATASDDDSITLWHGLDGSPAPRIEALLGGILDVDFAPSSLLLAAGSGDGVVGLYQVSDGHLLRALQGHQNAVRDVEFSPDGSLLASASDDHTLRLWQVSDGSLAYTLQGHTAPVRRLAFSPDGAWLASASEDHTIKMWQVSDGSLVTTMREQDDFVLDLAFSPDGSLLASGSEYGMLKLWQAASGETLCTLTDYPDSITSVAFSPDGHLLVSGAADGVLEFWGLSEAIPVETETP